MTPAAAAVGDLPATLTAGLQALLGGFTGARGEVLLVARSLLGFGEKVLQMDPGRPLPLTLLELLHDRWAVQLALATRAVDGGVRALPYGVAWWPIPLDFSADTGWRQRPRDEAVAAVSAALHGFACPPSFVIDSFSALTALWSLDPPIDLARDGAPVAIALQRALAGRLGADLGLGQDVRVPLPGSIVRDAGTVPPLPVVQFAVVAPARCYAVPELEAACAPEAPARRKGMQR